MQTCEIMKNKSKKVFDIFYSWNFGSINIRTGDEKSEGSKMYMVTKNVASKNLLFCSLQEVRYRNNGDKIISLDTGESYAFKWSGPKRRRDAGVGVLIKKCDEVSCEDPDIMNPRLIAMNLKVCGFNIRLVNAYAPTDSDSSESKKDEFYRLLRKACITQKNQKLIVTGDFNATTSVSLTKCNYNGTQIIDDPLCNDNGSRIKTFCRSMKLSMSQTYFEHPLEERYTWFSSDGKTKKVLDYVLVNELIQNYIKECKVCQNFDIESDHRMVITSVCSPKTKKARRKVRQKQIVKQKLDENALKNEDTRKKFVQWVTKSILETGIDESIDKSNTIIKTLNSAAQATLPNKRKNNKTNETWKDDIDLNALLSERSVTAHGSVDFKRLTKLIKRRVNHLRNEKIKAEADIINEHANRKEVEQLFRKFKSDNSSFKNERPISKCEPSKLKAYFHKHFTSPQIEEEPIELEDVPEFITKLKQISTQKLNVMPPEEKEIVEVIKNLKETKASNDIPIAFIKCATDSKEFITEIVQLYQSVWETNVIPKCWGHSKLVALWKGASKGKSNDATSYRGLQIGSSLCKILSIIIINRLKCWYDSQLLDQQQGFRAGRGTTDGIFIAKRVQQITDKMKKPVFLLFVDLTAAFDHVERAWLFKTIYQRFSNEEERKLIRLIESLYSFTTTALAETPDDIFRLTSGVRQGGPESPMLYNLYMDYVMRIFMNASQKQNIRFLKLKFYIPRSASGTGRDTTGMQLVDWIGYADDLLLFFEDEKSLCKGIKLLDEIFDRYRLSINVTKTKSMILNNQYRQTNYPKCISKLRGEELVNVTNYRYLGCEIKYDEPTTGDAELTLRYDAADSKFYSLSRNILNRKIKLKTRTMMLNSLVRSRMVYGCQTWCLTSTQTKKMDSNYFTYLRKMATGGYRRKEGSWSYVHTNEQLLNMSGTTSVNTFVHKQQKKYVAHLVRRPNTCMMKQLLFNSNKSKKRGQLNTLLTSVIRNERCLAEELFKNALERKF